MGKIDRSRGETSGFGFSQPVVVGTTINVQRTRRMNMHSSWSLLNSLHPVRQEALPEAGRIGHWGKAIFAGLIAGALFIAVEMFLWGITGRGSLWDPVRLSA